MEEPCFLLACQRNVTASSVQGQTGECSLQLSITPGLAETPIGSCLSSLSFISFCFHPFMFPRFLDPYLTLSLFPRLPHLWPSFHIGLVSICRLRADFTQTHGSSQTISPRARFRCFTLSASISNLIQSVAETQHVLLSHICNPPTTPTPPATHTQLNRLAPTCSNLQTLTQLILIIHYSILEYISLQDYNTGVRIFYLIWAGWRMKQRGRNARRRVAII